MLWGFVFLFSDYCNNIRFIINYNTLVLFAFLCKISVIRFCLLFLFCLFVCLQCTFLCFLVFCVIYMAYGYFCSMYTRYLFCFALKKKRYIYIYHIFLHMMPFNQHFQTTTFREIITKIGNKYKFEFEYDIDKLMFELEMKFTKFCFIFLFFIKWVVNFSTYLGILCFKHKNKKKKTFVIIIHIKNMAII